MGVITNENHIFEGIRKVCLNTGLFGRWQILSNKPLTVCDTGHNVAGWEYLSEQIKRQKCKTMRIVFGMVDDKDINSVMSLLPENATYYFTQASTHRAIPAGKVMEKAVAHGLNGTCYDCVEEAYRAALEASGDDDFIFVGGSFYVVSDFLKTCF